jgi:hypothetical protein
VFSDVTYPALFVMTQRIRFCILGLGRHSIVAIYVEESVCGSDGDLQVGLMTSPRLLMHVAPLMAPPRFPDRHRAVIPQERGPGWSVRPNRYLA